MATRINLLPWREERRARRQRDFLLTLFGAVVLAGGGVWGVNQYFQQLIDNQNARNDYLRTEIRKLDSIARQIQELDEAKAQLLARVRVIEGLQRSRPSMVRALDTLARRLPDDIYLTEMATRGRRITLKGTAFNPERVSEFMRELEQSPWFGEPLLTVIQNEEIGPIRASNFELAVNRAEIRSPDSQDGAVAIEE
ncbi:MAG: PilN domain-containing protein [Candidatus Competibacterales bacterium]